MTTIPRDPRLIQLLYELGDGLHQSENPKEVLEYSLKKIVEFFRVPYASISMFNPNTNRLDIEVYHGFPEDCREYTLPMGVGITGWVALHNRHARVSNVKKDPRYIEIHPEIRSALAVPLVNGSQSLGVLSVESRELDAFQQSDLEVLDELGKEIVKVQGRIWRIHNLSRKNQQMLSIFKMVGQLSNRFELNGVLVDLTREARKILDCRMCSLFLLNGEKNLELEVLVGAEGVIEHQENIALEDTSMEVAVSRAKTVEVHNLIETEENHFVEIISSQSLKSMLITPIVYEREVIGVLNVYTAVPHRFSNTEKQIFQALADMGAFAIENAKLYNRIMDSEDALRNSERLTTLGLLSAEIAHEIRNPLTVIKLLVESLSLDPNLDDQSHKDLNVVSEKIRDLTEIVGRVLNFGKSQSQMHSRWELGEIIGDSIQLVRYKLHRNKIRVHHDVDANVKVSCHKGQIQQVLLNLFINAEEAMPRGGEIWVRTEVDTSLKRVNVYFSDNGCGIPDTIREGIFDSFLSGKPSGSGLGLSIVKRILQEHRGNIEIADSTPKGTTFCFWLPLPD